MAGRPAVVEADWLRRWALLVRGMRSHRLVIGKDEDWGYGGSGEPRWVYEQGCVPRCGQGRPGPAGA